MPPLGSLRSDIHPSSTCWRPSRKPERARGASLEARPLLWPPQGFLARGQRTPRACPMARRAGTARPLYPRRCVGPNASDARGGASSSLRGPSQTHLGPTARRSGLRAGFGDDAGLSPVSAMASVIPVVKPPKQCFAQSGLPRLRRYSESNGGVAKVLDGLTAPWHIAFVVRRRVLPTRAAHGSHAIGRPLLACRLPKMLDQGLVEDLRPSQRVSNHRGTITRRPG
jgi:hypothetical protein